MRAGDTWGPHQAVLNAWHERTPSRELERCDGTLKCEDVTKAHALLVCDRCNADVAVPAIAQPRPSSASSTDDIPF